MEQEKKTPLYTLFCCVIFMTLEVNWSHFAVWVVQYLWHKNVSVLFALSYSVNLPGHICLVPLLIMIYDEVQVVRCCPDFSTLFVFQSFQAFILMLIGIAIFHCLQNVRRLSLKSFSMEQVLQHRYLHELPLTMAAWWHLVDGFIKDAYVCKISSRF